MHKHSSPTTRLLAWYDLHQRTLPWRMIGDQAPDPYHVWLSEIMLQQTTVAAVIPYFARFLTLFPTIEALANAPSEHVMQAWAGLGYYSRARNLHACAKKIVTQYNSEFPRTAHDLQKLPGIGVYTSAAIAAISFGEQIVAVDGNVERVISRFYALDESLPSAKSQVREKAQALMPPTRCGDMVQALMELGATVCTPRQPACHECPWHSDCLAFERGTPAAFPIKTPKKAAQHRFGIAYIVTRTHADNREILLRTRPPKGLLGGMAEVPTSEWLTHQPDHASYQEPFFEGTLRTGSWIRHEGHVKHIFTHIVLMLSVVSQHVPENTPAPEGMRWVNVQQLNNEPLSNLMLKVLSHAHIKGDA